MNIKVAVDLFKQGFKNQSCLKYCVLLNLKVILLVRKDTLRSSYSCDVLAKRRICRIDKFIELSIGNKRACETSDG